MRILPLTQRVVQIVFGIVIEVAKIGKALKKLMKISHTTSLRPAPPRGFAPSAAARDGNFPLFPFGQGVILTKGLVKSPFRS